MLSDKSTDVYKAIFTALNGALSYNGVDVPVYSALAFIPTEKYWVHIGEYNQLPRSSKLNFGYRSSVLIETVITDGDYMAAKSIVEQICNTLYPTVNSTILLDNGIVEILGEPQISEIIEQADGFIYIRKLIRLDLTLS